MFTFQTPYTITAPDKATYALDQYIADIWDRYIPAGQYGVTTPQPYYAKPQSQGNQYPTFQTLAAYRAQPSTFPIYSVWRLDGATAAIAKGLVNKALAAEGSRLSGQVCIDRKSDLATALDYGAGAGEWDLHQAAVMSATAAYSVIEDANPAEFGTSPAPLRCEGAALYAGWYSLNHYNDAFSWAPGAIGFHLDSASAADPRGGPNWSANALMKGITATAGAVSEPYLSRLLTSRWRFSQSL